MDRQATDYFIFLGMEAATSFLYVQVLGHGTGDK